MGDALIWNNYTPEQQARIKAAWAANEKASSVRRKACVQPARKPCTWPYTLASVVAVILLPFNYHLAFIIGAGVWVMGWFDQQRRDSKNLERLRELAEKSATAPPWVQGN